MKIALITVSTVAAALGVTVGAAYLFEWVIENWEQDIEDFEHWERCG
jgi:hypothetical protein